MRDERRKEELKKQARSNKHKAKQHSTPKAVTFPKKMSYLRTAPPLFCSIYTYVIEKY